MGSSISSHSAPYLATSAAATLHCHNGHHEAEVDAEWQPGETSGSGAGNSDQSRMIRGGGGGRRRRRRRRRNGRESFLKLSSPNGFHIRRRVVCLWRAFRPGYLRRKLRGFCKFAFRKRNLLRSWGLTASSKKASFEILLKEFEMNRDWCLIPGLPDDLALQCLARVPRVHHSLLRSVCKPWRWIVESQEFVDQRQLLGCDEEWLYLHVGTSPHLDEIREGKKVRWQLMGGYSRWHALDVKRCKWNTLPPIPYDRNVTGGQVVLGASSAVLKGKLYVIGGAPFGKAAIRDVWVYDPRKNKWVKGPPMATPRFACLVGVIEGRLYVVGGSAMCHLTGYSLPCLEVLDLSAEGNPNPSWRFVASARGVVSSHPCSPLKYAAVVGNKLCVMGPQSLGGGGGRVNAGMYDPDADTWAELWPGLREGWGKPSALLGGTLFTLDFGCYRWYCAQDDSWVCAEGQAKDALVGWDPRLVSAMAGSEHTLYMVGTMGPAMIILVVAMADGNLTSDIRWHTMRLPNGVDFLGDLGHCSCQVICY